MRTSSPGQREFDYTDPEPLPEDERTTFESAEFSEPTVPASSPSSAPSKLPDFSVFKEVYAVTSRMAGRVNAASVSKHEHKAILQERQALLDKKLNKTITRKEANRLEYVRWSLDRIEDAKHGQMLDALEDSVIRYERFLSYMGELEDKLRQHLKRKRK